MKKFYTDLMHPRGQVRAVGEHYHVYNRGANKQAIFNTPEDYKRFQVLLYLLNTESRIIVRDVLKRHQDEPLERIFIEEFCDKSQVDILAYTLMPNHFHLVLRERAPNGISHFMQKLCTAYSMYFNTVHDHSGVVFQGRYQLRHIDNEPYFRYIFAYVHLNPLELKAAEWKESGLKKIPALRTFISSYPYSSYFDHYVGRRPERAILETNDIPGFLKHNDFEDLVAAQLQESPTARITKAGPWGNGLGYYLPF